MSRMKMLASIVVVLFISAGQLLAQSWSFNAADYAYSGQVTGAVTFDGTLVTEGTLGAFVGSECRGYVAASFFPPTGKYVFNLLCFSNIASGETLTFKYYRPSDGLEYDVIETMPFVADMIIANASSPYVFTVISNYPPVVDNPVSDQSLSEHFGTADINISSVFSDADGDVLSYSVASDDPAVVTAAVLGTTLTLTEVGNGTANVTLTASDGKVTTDDVFTVTVTNVNDAPVVSLPLADMEIDEHFGSTTVSVDGVFTDPDGDVMTYSATSSNTSVATVSVTGTTLTITEAGVGSSNITVRASDGFLTGSDVFVLTVNNVNDAPVVSSAIPDQDLDEHFGTRTFNLATVFSDPDNDGLTFQVVSTNTSVVSAAVSGSTLTLTEAGIGSSTVTVTASDGSLTVDDVFNVTVTNVNDAPVVSSALPDLNKNEHFGSATVSIAGVFTDPDGDGMTYSATSSSTSVATVSVTGTTLTITEAGVGSSNITVTASDGFLTGSDVFILTVTNVNDSPVLVNPVADQILNEHFGTKTINISAVFSDPDNDVLQLSAGSSNTGVVTVSISGTTLTLTEVGLGTSTITLTAGDGQYSVSDQFTVTVENVNDAPVVTNPLADREYQEGFISATISLAPVFTDPDGDVLILSASSSNTAVASVSLEGNILTITEKGNGQTDITVTASDGFLSNSDVFVVTVKNVNDAPVVANPISDRTVNEHFGSSTVDLSAVFSDPDNDPLNYTAGSSMPSVVSVSISGSTLTITEGIPGVSDITVTASDGSLTASDQFKFTVNNVNDAPVVDNPVSDKIYSEYFGSAVIDLSAVFSDPDGDNIILSVVSSNTSVVTAALSGTSLTLTEKGLGLSQITVTASDGSLTTDDVFTVDVNNINDAPMIVNQIPDKSYNEYFGTDVISIAGAFEDPDGDQISYSVVSANTDVVTVSLTGTDLTITEEGNGSTTVTLTATDGELSKDMQFKVTVVNVNEVPEVVNPLADQVLVEHIGSVQLDLGGVFTDPDGDNLSYVATPENSAVVSASVNEAELTLTGLSAGSSKVVITASDGSLSVNDTIMVTVLTEVPLVILYEGEVMSNEEVIVRCNDPAEFSLRVRTTVTWSSQSLSPAWLVVEVKDDSTLTVGYSENLTGEDRLGSILISDEQGHETELVIKQSAVCNPDGIDEAELFGFTVYPNPVEGTLTVALGDESGVVKVEVIDISGRTLMIREEWRERFNIDMETYMPGLYMIRVSGDRGSGMMKIIKQ